MAVDGASGEATTSFQCNLCGEHNTVAAARLQREVSSCRRCLSTVRFRSVAHLVVREVIGGDRTLREIGAHRNIRGVGLSDANAYARPLATHFDYTNTFFDVEPRLDITNVPRSWAGRYRFVIASDVFEHVAPPVSRAFAGARTLLADDGVLILTVPFHLDTETIEHYPNLHRFRIDGHGADAILHNVTSDGRHERYTNLTFHGGTGATLEMRHFSRAGLERELAVAGFSRVTFCGERCERFGVVWPEPWSVPIVARP